MIDFKTFECVIFDCDGVLVNSEPLANEVLASHATALGWSMDAERSLQLFKGMTMTQIHQRFEDHLQCSLNRDWIEQYYLDSFELFKKRLEPIDGIENLIIKMKRAGKKVCVASQGPHDKMRLTLGITNLWDYFEGNIYSAQDVPRPKPYPDLFLHAAAQMNVSPKQCCVIEDSQTGLKAARAAEMKVIYYAPEVLSSAKNQYPTDVVISHMDEV